MNMVIIKIVGLGDLLMLTPAIREYKSRFPSEKIIVITGDSNKEVLKNNPFVDEIVCVDDTALYNGSIISKANQALKLAGVLKRLMPVKVFILHRDWRWNALAMLSGVRIRHGFRRHIHSLFLTRVVTTTMREHEIDKYFKLFGIPGMPDRERCRMDIFPDAGDRERVDDFLSHFATGNIVAVSPGGAVNTKGEWPLKRWPLERYKDLIGLLVKDGYFIFLIGGVKDAPLSSRLSDYFKDIRGRQLYDLAGKHSIQETYSILTRCRLMVTHDSGPMHIAAAAGIPVISIFGPTSPDETSPLTKGSHYFWSGGKFSCAPCYRFGKMPHCRTNACMTDITVEQVYARIRETLTLSKVSCLNMIANDTKKSIG
jgi:lipopolysaccharide heptosyltransferase II